jgi:hypothetical protein
MPPPVTGRGEPAGLLDRQERLTAAGAAAHLDAIQQANSVENDRLVFGRRRHPRSQGHERRCPSAVILRRST